MEAKQMQMLFLARKIKEESLEEYMHGILKSD